MQWYVCTCSHLKMGSESKQLLFFFSHAIENAQKGERVKKAAVSTTIATSFLIIHDVDIVIRQFSRLFFT